MTSFKMLFFLHMIFSEKMLVCLTMVFFSLIFLLIFALLSLLLRCLMVYDVYLCDLYLLSLQLFIFVSLKKKKSSFTHTLSHHQQHDRCSQICPRWSGAMPLILLAVLTLLWFRFTAYLASACRGISPKGWLCICSREPPAPSGFLPGPCIHLA